MGWAAAQVSGLLFVCRVVHRGLTNGRTHSLRYVLKDRSTNTELFVIVFQLVPTEEAQQQGAKSPEDMFKSIHSEEAKDGKANVDEAKAGGDDDELD